MAKIGSVSIGELCGLIDAWCDDLVYYVRIWTFSFLLVDSRDLWRFKEMITWLAHHIRRAGKVVIKKFLDGKLSYPKNSRCHEWLVS